MNSVPFFLTCFISFGIIFSVIKMENEKTKNKLSKKMKVLIAFIVIIAVVSGSAIFVSLNETRVYNYGLYLLMPKTITAEEMGTDYDISVRFNNDYDYKTQETLPFEAFEYYYTDTSTGEEVVIKGTDQSEIAGVEIAPYVMFVIKAKMNLDTLKSVLAKAAWVAAAVIVVAAIVLWYKVWSKHEDAEKEKINNKKNHKKKKS